MRLTVLAVALAATVAACGSPDELSQAEGRQLEIARERIVATVELNARLASSPEEANRLLARVRKIVANGALEQERLDEFGLAALGELRLVAPSLVIVDRLEIPRELDREGLTALLENAKTDRDAATRIPAEREVERIEQLLGDADAGADTRVPVLDVSVGGYRRDLATRLQPLWPDLADEISD